MGSSPNNQAYIIREWEVSDIEGKVLTIVESAGLPEKQEDAIKGLIRQAIWGSFHNGWRLLLPSSVEEEVYRWNDEHKKGQGSDVPVKKTKS